MSVFCVLQHVVQHEWQSPIVTPYAGAPDKEGMMERLPLSSGTTQQGGDSPSLLSRRRWFPTRRIINEEGLGGQQGRRVVPQEERELMRRFLI